MDSVITQENLKAVGVLAASFLASIVLASFFYIQPGSAQASAEDDSTCSSQATVEDIASGEETVRIKIESSPTCPENPLTISVLSEEGYETFLFDVAPDISPEGVKNYTADIEISRVAKAYLIHIDGAFSASIVP